MAALEVLGASKDIELAQEANHRIANHLSLVAGMVQAQAWALARGPETLSRVEVHSLLQDAAGKILSVGNLHRKLSQSPHEHEIDLGAYLVENCGILLNSLSLTERVGIVYTLGERCMISPEAGQSLGLIVNEIVMNAVKYAHPTEIPVQIQLHCGRDEKSCVFVDISDDGVGLPENFVESRDGGVGFRLIRTLAGQLKAALQIRSDSLGLSFRVTLPA